jgi:hypothetical protein
MDASSRRKGVDVYMLCRLTRFVRYHRLSLTPVPEPWSVVCHPRMATAAAIAMSTQHPRHLVMPKQQQAVRLDRMGRLMRSQPKDASIRQDPRPLWERVRWVRLQVSRAPLQTSLTLCQAFPCFRWRSRLHWRPSCPPVQFPTKEALRAHHQPPWPLQQRLSRRHPLSNAV